MPTHFKLRFDDLTRRASFAHQPNWQELSEKIASLYSIPHHRVGVTYIDAENEEITLNTEDELQDYYFSSYRPGELITFSIRDLNSRNRRPSPPANSGARNTFGQFVDIPGLDEWQTINHIPSLDEIFGRTSPDSEVRSAFVESVATERDTPTDMIENSQVLVDKGIDEARSEASEPRIPADEKGKERSQSVRSMTSTQSLLAADEGDKHPVHVYDVSSHSRAPVGHGFSFDQAGAAIAAESTPRVSAQPLEQDAPTLEKKLERTQEFDDPPLPSFDSSTSPPQPTESTQSTQASANLSRDVASFLNTVSGIISSHPELSESLRTIVRNTTNGTYWAAHREALSHAAAEFQRSTENLAGEGRRVVEEEAGRRVAEALAGVLRIFSQAQATVQPDTHAQSSSATIDPNNQHPNSTDVPPSDDTRPQPTGFTPRPETPPMPGAFASTNFSASVGGGASFPFGRRHTWRARASMPPNLIPNLQAGGAYPGGIPGWAMPHRHSPFGPGVLNATTATTTTQGGLASQFVGTSTPAAAAEPVHKPDQISPETSTSTESNERLSPEESKAKVEEARKAYKAEKERYRREREERRKDKDKIRTPRKEDTSDILQNFDTITSTPEVTQIASNARHDFPRFDIVNISGPTPQRHNTHLGHFPRRPDRLPEDLFTRAVNRISRRLADMGFTEKAYPDLPQKIKELLPSDGAIAKDREDDIVTTLLEAMLVAPKSPVASGSGSRDIPGGWH